MKPEVRITIVPNKSKTYLLPILNEQVKFEFPSSILNTYSSFRGDDELFCVLYKWSSAPEFLKFEGILMEHHLFEGHKDYGDKVLYKFRLPQAIEESKVKLFASKLKEFDARHKKLILDELKRKGVSNIGKITQILDSNSKVTSTLPVKSKEIFMNHLKIMTHKADDFVYEGS
jgi:hypothetical protein